MKPFDAAIRYLFQNEGNEFSNDPIDLGGPTKYGVTLEAWADFVKEDVSADDIENLTVRDVKPFYREKYWNLNQCDRITDTGMAIAIFDTSVLYGPAIAAGFAQMTLNTAGLTLVVDGIIGEKTLQGLNDFSRGEFLDHYVYLALRRIEEVVRRKPLQAKFELGWKNRATRLLTLKVDTTFNS